MNRNNSRHPRTSAASSRPSRDVSAVAGPGRGAGQEEQPPSHPPVIYIAGSGRSGSTTLERVLGEIPGFVNVGELIDLFRRPLDAERCGCGQVFGDCPFWIGVGARAFGGWDTGCLSEASRLQSLVARQRHLPQLLAMATAGREFRGHVGAYAGYLRRLYEAIAAEAGAQYIVDSSKWPVQALALARGGLDVRVIHLVRDARGVAYSLSKKQVARPHSLAGGSYMWRSTPAGAAARWITCQGQAELLRGARLRVARMRYEDFVREPRNTVEGALTQLGLPPRPPELAHIGEHSVTLSKSHGLSGNPSRFHDGKISLRADEVWRDRMPAGDRLTVTALALPFLVRYGRRGSGRQAAASAPVTAPKLPERAQWPDVSVIIATRGRPELVRETIAAVTAQTYPGVIDCVVVHDHEPPDEELTRLGSPRRRIRVMTSTHVPGLAGARNAGLSVVTGEYIATCDDDDLWHPEKLQFQIARLLDEPDLLAVGSGTRLLLPGGRVLDWPGRAERIGYQLLLRNRVKELHSSTLVMRRDTFTRVGRYDEEIPFGYGEDYDWVLRIAKAGSIGLIRQPLADIRRGGTSWYQGSQEKVAAGLEHLLAKHPDFRSSRRGHARLLGQIAFARSSLGQRGVALRLTVHSLFRWPLSPYPYIALAHITTGLQPRYMLRAAGLFRREMA